MAVLLTSFEYLPFYKADFSNKRLTIIIKVNCCVFDLKLFRIVKSIRAICTFWFAWSYHLLSVLKMIMGSPTYDFNVEWGNQKKNEACALPFSFPSSLEPVHHLWQWWWQSCNSNSVPLPTKNWIMTIVLQVHPFWYLLHESPLKMHMLCWGETVHNLHAMPKMHKQIILVEAQNSTNTSKLINYILFTNFNNKYCFLLGNTPHINH